MAKQHFAAPAHDDVRKCKTCGEPIFRPDPRFPGVFKHYQKRKAKS